MLRYTSSAFGGTGLGLGLWLIEITNPTIPEWAIGGLAMLAGLMVLYGVVGFGLSLRGQQASVPSTNDRPTERELTTQEKEWIAVVDGRVYSFHGHYDYIALVEDCQRGRELSRGLCGLCGRPRNHVVLGTGGGTKDIGDDEESRQRESFTSEHQWYVPFL